ncbi:MAG: hypothetical protein MUF78_04410, partial [Candidatus Edwardsbacteria bacterium]|nr:hypothetical protein [Candidatus Edwardsbacteria bacterium]
LPDLTAPRTPPVYHKSPWTIYRGRSGWTYVGDADRRTGVHHLVARFDRDHGDGDIYAPDARAFGRGGLGALTMFPTDQVLLARLLADRRGALLHGAGAVMGGRGLLFLHSSAGKSTICGQLGRRATVLCDDRCIVRRDGKGFRLYGTWSHGTYAKVSPASAPLTGLFLLKQSRRNAVTPVSDRAEALQRLLPLAIKPLATADWWEKTLDTLQDLSGAVPAYELEFDRGGGIVGPLGSLLDGARRWGRT